jgi:quercetin dioxygenase-like cupin family protein
VATWRIHADADIRSGWGATALYFRAMVRAPTHHHAVEEVVTVLEGEAEVWLNDSRTNLKPGQSLIVRAGQPHGFQNNGSSTLHIQFTLAAPIFEGAYEDQRETPRRWRTATRGGLTQ